MDSTALNVKDLSLEERRREEKNQYIKRYSREILRLEESSERLTRRIYQSGIVPTLEKRYQLILDLFKGALLREAIGDKEGAKWLGAELNGEFEDFYQAMENPECALVFYQRFRTYFENLGLTLGEDHTESIERKATRYRNLQKEEQPKEKKGLLRRVVDGVVNYFIAGYGTPPPFDVTETLDDIMLNYQKRFAVEIGE